VLVYRYIQIFYAKIGSLPVFQTLKNGADRTRTHFVGFVTDISTVLISYKIQKEIQKEILMKLLQNTERIYFSSEIIVSE